MMMPVRRILAASLLSLVPCVVLSPEPAGADANAADAETPTETKTPPRDTPIVLEVGDMEFRYHPHGGVRLSVFGVPFVKGSTLYCIKPTWVDRFYAQDDNPFVLETAVVEDYGGGKRITLTHVLPEHFESPYVGKEIFELLPDNTYRATQQFRFTKDEPVILEWKTGGINPAPMLGAAFTARVDGKTVTGTVPPEAVGPRVEESMFAQSFESIDIESRFGPIRIESTPEDKISFFDYRKNRWAKTDDPIFWLGALERPLVKDKDYEYTVTIRFPSTIRPVSTTVEPKLRLVETERVRDAKTPNAGRDFIIPKPKSLEFEGGRMPISSKTRIYVGPEPGPDVENALDFLVEEWREVYGIEPVVVREAVEERRLRRGAIVLGETKRHDLAAKLCADAGLLIPEHKEGYVIHVDDRRAAVAASTVQGLFYGITSLVQMVDVQPEGIALKTGRVHDYPSLDFRGVHCLSGKDAGDEIAKALRTLMARYKINTLVWECQYIVWDGHEDIEHPAYGMTKDEARKVIAGAERNFIEIIPLVQSLGHSEWIFVNDRNLDIAEDPETPYAYSPTNPDTYKFIFDVYGQAVDLFKPRYFHIGHDEVTMRGRFPWRSRDTGLGVTDLLVMDIKKLHEWFTKQGIRVMLWGDMFLHRDEATDAAFAPTVEEAQKRRSLLPKDVAITDWHYAAEPPENYTSIPLWHGLGFETIGAGWDNPINIANLSRACIDTDAKGYLQTTWAGFNFKIDGNEIAWHQYWAYILAGHYAWSGDPTPHYDLPFSAREMFLGDWFGRRPLLKPRAGRTVDLRGLMNRRLEDDEKGEGWLGYGPEFDMAAFPVGELRAGESRFHLDRDALGHGAVMLAGRFNPKGEFPEAVQFFVKPTHVASIQFLMNCAFQTVEKTRVGEIVVNYADGTAATMDLVYGSNIFAFYDHRVGTGARIAWEGEAKSGKIVRAWDVDWVNPHPERPIRSVTIRSTGTEGAPILFATTLVDPEKSRRRFLGLF